MLIRFLLTVTNTDERNALAALAAVALSLGLGLVAAALGAPPLVRRHGPRRSASVALAVAAVGSALPLLTLRLGALLVAWAFIGAGAQVLKITVDTVLQRALPDDVRGRVFIAYDIVFNVAFVMGVAAVALPPVGRAGVVGAADLVAVAALVAQPAADDVVNHHPVAEPEVAAPWSHLDDLAAGFVAGDHAAVGLGAVAEVLAVDRADVAPADRRGPHPQQHLTVSR